MIEQYINISFVLLILISIISIVGLVPLLLIQHLIHKKKLDPLYFNSKHYSDYELQIFTTFPLLLIKTIGYIKAITFPGSMRRKFKTDIIKPGESPLVFLLAWITMIIIIAGALILINTGVSAIFYYSTNA